MQSSCTIEIHPATPITQENSTNFNKTNTFIDYSQDSSINDSQSSESENSPNESISRYIEIKPSCSSHSISISQRLKSSNLRSYSKSLNASIALSKSNTHIPSWRTHKYGKYCWKSWITFVHLVIAFRAIIVRIGFICFTCTAIVSVVKEKQDGRFWFLALTIIPLLIDLIVAINAYVSGRSVTPTISKWFSLCNFTYLICACPPIWIIELHHMDQVNNASALLELITTKNHTPVMTTPSWIDKVPPLMTRENESMMIMGTEIEEFMHSAYLTTTSEPQNLRRITRDAYLHEVLSNETVGLQVSMDVLQSLQLHNFSLKERIRILEQLLLLSVIVGRWLMPREGLTRDQLSQLLLINIGTAADILELFEAFNEQEVRRNDFLRTVILSLWQASLLQFCFNKTALKKPKNYNSNLPLFKTNELSSFQYSSDEKSLSNAESGLTVKNNNENNSNENNTELNVKDQLPRRGTLASLKQWYSKRKQENTDRNDCDIINAECGSSLKTSQSEMHQQQQQSQQQKFQQSPQLLLPPPAITSDIPKSISQNDFVDNYNDHCCPLMRGCLLLCHERPCLCCETELWAIGISLMLQDLPFLILRLTLIVYYNVKSYSNVFFTCKNTLLILLQVFRSIVILSESSKF
ncbi:hypothetical protein MN116_001711 [Schistosoma mekongi]|uniref:Transmembrane protein 26 n=1 Tax=Schistosoma mekongi TaxID=38744 RepID=A0AAE1ZIM8_SCHME|nr:hypothetical protein MN116_001711 [Schistosoma mekongi]